MAYAANEHENTTNLRMPGQTHRDDPPSQGEARRWRIFFGAMAVAVFCLLIWAAFYRNPAPAPDPRIECESQGGAWIVGPHGDEVCARSLPQVP